MTKAEQFGQQLQEQLKNSASVTVDGETVICCQSFTDAVSIQENVSEVLFNALLDQVVANCARRGAVR